MPQVETITIDWRVSRKALENIPELGSPTFNYTGGMLTPSWGGLTDEYVDIEGDFEASEPGVYTVVFTPKPNYCWSDGTIDPRIVTWTIKATGEQAGLPYPSKELTYNGYEQTPSWINYDPAKMSVIGTTSATNAGTYKAIFTLEDGYVWIDGTVAPQEVRWTINKKKLSSSLNSLFPDRTFDYTGSEIVIPTGTLSDYVITGETSGTEIGTYQFTIAPSENCTWEDGSTDPITVDWGVSMGGYRLIFPDDPDYPPTSDIYPGDPRYPTKQVKNPDFGKDIYPGDPLYPEDGDGEPIAPTGPFEPLTLSFTSTCNWAPGSSKLIDCSFSKYGSSVRLAPGTYSFSWTNTANLGWDGGGFYKPTSSMTLAETKVVQVTPDGARYTSTASSSTTNPKYYVRTMTCTIRGTLKDVYRPEYFTVPDGECAITVENTGPIWVPIEPVELLSLPKQKGTLVYDGTAQMPQWSGYDESFMDMADTCTGIDAGVYYAEFSIRGPYAWKDKCMGYHDVEWIIEPQELSPLTVFYYRSFEYTGEEISLPENPEKYTLSGVTSATDKGVYEAIVTPTQNYIWPNGTRAPRTILWGIAPEGYKYIFPDEPDHPDPEIKIEPNDPDYPTKQITNPMYGKELVISDKDYPADGDGQPIPFRITIDELENVTYTKSFTYYRSQAQGNYEYSLTYNVGTRHTISVREGNYKVSWAYQPSSTWLTFSRFSPTDKTYTGTTTSVDVTIPSSITLNSKTYASYTAKLTLTGKAKKIIVNPAYAACRPQYLTAPDGDQPIIVYASEPILVPWQKAKDLETPMQIGELVYSGLSQLPTWDGYDPQFLNLQIEAQINAGTYKATFTPVDGKRWTNGSNLPREVEWIIVPRPFSFDPNQLFSIRSFTYNGLEQTLETNAPDKIILYGKITAKETGTYEAKVVPTSNYTWDDGTSAYKVVDWGIAPAGYRYVFPGQSAYPIEEVTVEPGDRRYPKKEVENPKYGEDILPTDSDYPYNGDGEPIPKILSTYGFTVRDGYAKLYFYSAAGRFIFDPARSVLKTTYKVREPGLYEFFITPEKEWTSAEWTLLSAIANLNGVSFSSQRPAEIMLDEEHLSGEVKFSDSPALVPEKYTPTYGTMHISTCYVNHRTVAHSDNPAYCRSTTIWVDDGTEPATVINTDPVLMPCLEYPKQVGTLTYNGQPQSPVWSGYPHEGIIGPSSIQGTNVGTYRTTFGLEDGYVWMDGTSKPIVALWKIEATSVSAPSQSGSLTYNGSTQYPVWNGFDSALMSISGTLSAQNAGDYKATFTLNDGCVWTDGTDSPKEIPWTIDQAIGVLGIDKTNLSFDSLENTQTITALSNLPHAVMAVSSDTSVVTVQVDGKQIIVTPVGNGSAIIGISMPNDKNYVTPAGVYCEVSVSYEIVIPDPPTPPEPDPPEPELDLTDPQVFREVIVEGKGPSLLAVGDPVTIPVNGTLNAVQANGSSIVPYSLPFSGDYSVPILGFNHNKPTEGSGNYVDLQFAVNPDTKKLLVFGNAVVRQDGAIGFQMNSITSNAGGWKDSKINQETGPAFFQLIDLGWRGVVIPATKYSDNVGGGVNDPTHVNASSSNVWILSSYEVIGQRVTANTGEVSKQRQYAMYANGCYGYSYDSYLDETAGSSCWSRSSLASLTYEEFEQLNEADIQAYASKFNYLTQIISVSNCSATQVLGIMPCMRIG